MKWSIRHDTHDLLEVCGSFERWCSFVESQYYYGKCVLGFNLCETSPYSSGVWVSWGTDGSGVTSCKADFSMNLTNEGTEITVDYAVNVTFFYVLRSGYGLFSFRITLIGIEDGLA